MLACSPLSNYVCHGLNKLHKFSIHYVDCMTKPLLRMDRAIVFANLWFELLDKAFALVMIQCFLIGMLLGCLFSMFHNLVGAVAHGRPLNMAVERTALYRTACGRAGAEWMKRVSKQCWNLSFHV